VAPKNPESFMPYKDQEAWKKAKRERYNSDEEYRNLLKSRVLKHYHKNEKEIKKARAEVRKHKEKKVRPTECLICNKTFNRIYGKQKCCSDECSARLRRHQHIIRAYGISIHEYERLMVEQNFLCAICKTSGSENRNLDVDHHHESKKVRGLLCGVCNRRLGFFESAINELIEPIALPETWSYKAMQYLKRL
jgi:Recombination endonuclease VII